MTLLEAALCWLNAPHRRVVAFVDVAGRRHLRLICPYCRKDHP